MQTITKQDEVKVKEVIWEWVVNENDFDLREIQDLVHVNAEVDGRSRV